MATLKITFTDAADLDRQMEALGFRRVLLSSTAAPKAAYQGVADAASVIASPIAQIVTFSEKQPGFTSAAELQPLADLAAVPPFVHTPTPRPPGQPSPGHKRRTKAEIAEDEAYFAAQKPSDETTATAATGDEPESIFSTQPIQGVETVDPTDAEAAAQDAADEAAETAAAKPDGKLTMDDLRKACGVYQKAHGIAATVKNIPLIVGKPLHEVGDDELADAIRKVEIAAGVPSVTASPVVVAAIEAAQPSPTSGAPATIEGVKAAFGRYALRYDGQCADLSQAGAPCTQEDGKKIVKAAVGVENIAVMPKDPETCAKLIAAIDDAVANNPFGRKVLK